MNTPESFMPRRASAKDFMERKFHRQNKGYVTLLSVLIVGALGTAVATTLIILGLGSSRTSFTLAESSQARAFSNACAEEALESIREVPGFSGSGGLTFSQGTCSFTVVSTGGENREIKASSTVGRVVRKVKIILDRITPKINVTSWQEVADF